MIYVVVSSCVSSCDYRVTPRWLSRIIEMSVSSQLNRARLSWWLSGDNHLDEPGILQVCYTFHIWHCRMCMYVYGGFPLVSWNGGTVVPPVIIRFWVKSPDWQIYSVKMPYLCSYHQLPFVQIYPVKDWMLLYMNTYTILYSFFFVWWCFVWLLVITEARPNSGCEWVGSLQHLGYGHCWCWWPFHSEFAVQNGDVHWFSNIVVWVYKE